MLVYLFRDESNRQAFAYSTDVTGRNIPRHATGTKWSYVAVGKLEELRHFEEAGRDIRRHGFHVFQRSDAH